LPVLARWPEGSPAQFIRSGKSAKRRAIRVVDGAFAIYQGPDVLKAGPFSFESLWSDPRVCRAASGETLAIAYDHLAERWILSRWATPASRSAFPLCVAVSRTADPLASGWFLYNFVLPVYRHGTGVELGPNVYSLMIDRDTHIAFVFDRKRLLKGAPVEPFQAPAGQTKSKG